MQNNVDHLKKYVMKFSYREKRNQKLEKFRKEVKVLNDMDIEELEFEYIDLKSKYEHKKSILTLLLLTIALTILMDVWKKFFSFIGRTINLSYYITILKKLKKLLIEK